jgi:hypothetical protein
MFVAVKGLTTMMAKMTNIQRVAPLARLAQASERPVGRDLRQFVRRAEYVAPALVVRASGAQRRLGCWWDLRYR